MRVLFVVHRMHPNLSGIHHALVSAGHGCTFVVAKIGPSEPECCADRIHLESSKVAGDAVTEILDSIRPDLIIQRNIEGIFLEFWKSASIRGIRRILYTQDPHQIPTSDVFLRPLRVLRLIRDIVRYRMILGPHQRVTPVRYWGQPGRLTFPNSEYLPFPAIPTTRRIIQNSPVVSVLTVAKHGQKRKRVDWLVRALRQTKTPFQLVLAGSSPAASEKHRKVIYASTLRQIASLGPRAQHVRILEDLDRAQMAALYETADIFVLPSKREQMAISPLEAMAHGLPVLTSSDGGAASYTPVSKEQIFRARSYRDFRAKLFRLIDDDGMRQDLGKRALNQVRSVHSPDVFVAKLVAISELESTG